MADFNEAIINAKYHLAVVERMFRGYKQSCDKRFLVGIINEAARAISNLIAAFLIREGIKIKNTKKNLKIFEKCVASKYLDAVTRENLLKMLEIRRAQKESPIEYARGEKIILLIKGKYRFLTAERIQEFVESIRKAIKEFQKDFR